jgi:uncharacterized membrane protein (UPF0182 family)
VDLWAELQWFRSLGFQARFWKLEGIRVVAWLVVFVVTAATVWTVLRAVLRRGGPVQVRRRLGDLEISEALPERWVTWGLVGAAGLAGFLVAGPFAAPLGRQVLFAVGADAWGTTDPILGHDPRFYVFYLPLLRTVWSVLVAAATWTGIGLASLLLLSGRIRATEQGVTLDPLARKTLTWTGVAVLLLVASHFALSTFETVAGGPVGYADVHGEIPARRLLAALALITAGAVVWSQRTGAWRPALTALVVLGVTWPAGLLVYPEMIQRFKVEPNELELERPYLDAEIQATRRAFGLREIRRLSYDISTDAPSLERVRQHTSGLPLWDERPLKSTYDQLQGLLAYHEFPDVDVDRYGEPGSVEQVAVGVREFAPGRLASSARTWQNLHLRYTHGTGWVVTAVDRATEGGEPRYFVRDLPPGVSEDAPSGLTVAEPNVYFGERTTQYVVVPRDSFPEAGVASGAALSNVFQRAMFAWALDSKNLLLRNPGEGAPRLMWHRHVARRVQRVAPFLLVDPDVYPVVHEGRVKWIVEGYAASNRFPLSNPAEIGGRRANYLRSVVKGVVDGVTGEVTLYTVDPDDPLLATYREVFPDLFRPTEEMPRGLRRHLRYPPTLFRTQAGVLEAYHMTEPDEFYQRQDLWSLGREIYDGQPRGVEPYFLLMPFPGRTEAAGAPPADTSGAPAGGGRAGEGAAARLEQEFLLTVPFTPRNRDNLSSFLMARNDGEHYGELWLFDLSGQRQVFGPRQVEVQIDQDPVISQQLSLWQQRGSRAIRGHLLLVPVDGFLVYIEPLFLVAEDREGAAPGLKRVIAAAGDRVAMGETLDDALRRLMGEAARTAPLEADTDVAGAPETGDAGAAAAPPALDRVRQLLRQADRALRDGDLARFGDLWRQIREAAGAPAGATGADTTAAGTAGAGEGEGPPR